MELSSSVSIVPKKNNCTPSQFYMKNCEYIIFCRKGKAVSQIYLGFLFNITNELN